MKYQRFTEEQLEYVNHINIIEYARSQGYPVEEYAKGYYKISGYGGLLIEPDKWYWETVQKGGGPIQFVMEIRKLTWVEAVKELLNVDLKVNANYLYYPTEEEKKKKYDKSKFELPGRNDTYKHLFAYLVNVRKLDQELVQQLVKDKKLYEDYNQNCVFVGYDREGTARYAFRRGTKPDKPFRGDVASSDKRYGFRCEGSTNRLFVFEAAIDLISYQTLKKRKAEHLKDHYISLAGGSLVALEQYLMEHPEIQVIAVCTDNDESGEAFYSRIGSTYEDAYKVERYSPAPYKDFNELLCRKILHEFLQSQGFVERSQESQAARPP